MSSQKVMVVNCDMDSFEEIEAVLDAGNYDLVFIESASHAYSRILEVQPDLVIVCVDLNDPASIQVLTMLKFDAQTTHIPIVSYITLTDGTETDEEYAEDEPDHEIAALRMN